MSNNQKNQPKCEITPLGVDDRLAAIIPIFFEELKKETAFRELTSEVQNEMNSIFEKIQSMRFKSGEDFQEVSSSLIKGKAPSLVDYIKIAFGKASQKNQETNKGVLVIYTGGTIGSAPKDINDPESPQIVKQWPDLKFAIPGLDRIGFRIDAISFVEPLDSCNVGPVHWLTMAEIIEKYYSKYEGFVILHGTDTMVYTASALSFMLLNLAKPVVITGSQIAGIVNYRNDAHQNFITSLMIANPTYYGYPVIPEVCVYFGGHLIRGCRTKKMDAASYEGFNSPNYPLLGTAGDTISVDKLRLRKAPEGIHQIDLLKKLETNVITIDVFPGMQNSDVAGRMLQDENLKGVVLRAYGTGNIPTDKAYLDQFNGVLKRGVVIIVSQCPAGSVEMGLYETSQVLLDRGFIGGFDITAEAALCKLMILLGEYGDDIPYVKEMMQRSLAGEQKYSVLSTPYKEPGKIDATTTQFDFSGAELNSIEDASRIEHAVLRFYNARLNPSITKNRSEIELYLNLNRDAPKDDDERLIKSYSKGKVPNAGLTEITEAGESLTFDVSLKKEFLVSRGDATGPHKNRKPKDSFSVVYKSADGSFEWDHAELVLFVTEE